MVEEGGGVGITCNGGDSSQTEIQYPVNSRQPSPCQTNSQKQRHIPAGCRHSGRTDDKVLGDCVAEEHADPEKYGTKIALIPCVWNSGTYQCIGRYEERKKHEI